MNAGVMPFIWRRRGAARLPSYRALPSCMRALPSVAALHQCAPDLAEKLTP